MALLERTLGSDTFDDVTADQRIGNRSSQIDGGHSRARHPARDLVHRNDGRFVPDDEETADLGMAVEVG